MGRNRRTWSLPRVFVEDPDLNLERFGAVPNTLAWEAVADHLRASIKQGAFLPGEQLPPERELAKTLGVSRVTLNQALGFLYGERLIEKTGRSSKGGPRVLPPPRLSDEEKLKELGRALPRILELLECRLGLEPFIASRAARKRTLEHVRDMQKSVEDMKAAWDDLESPKAPGAAGSTEAATKEAQGRAKFWHSDSVFHHAVAAATGNSRLVGEVQSLRNELFAPATVDVLYGYGDLQNVLLQNAISEHERILKAIWNQKEPEAGEAMRDHIIQTKKALCKPFEEQSDTTTRLEVRIALEGENPEADDRGVPELLKESNVWVISSAESVNDGDVTAENGFLPFAVDGPTVDGSNGEKQTMVQVIVPVFTRLDFLTKFLNAARKQNPEGQSLTYQQVSGGELLSALESDQSEELTVTINPWSALEFNLPVEALDRYSGVA